MGDNTLAVKVTAEIVDLQTKFGVAKAEAGALTKAFNDLAKQSAAGLLDPAGLAQLQEASRAMLEAKANIAELKEEMAGAHESSVNFGEGLSELRGQLSNAFEITGIAAAYEGIKQIGEAVEELGGRAIQMRAMSDVLGVSTDEFQAMSVAAEEGGTSIEIFARAQEKLISLMTQARDGSGAAAEKLLILGLTAQQINDPTTKITEVLDVLRERLLNSATAQDTMNELIRDFGPRAALAAEAIRAYDGSQAAVADTMARLNGLSTQQSAKLSEMAIKWGELKIWIEDTASKALIAAEGFRELYVAYSRWVTSQVPSAVPKLPEQQKGTIDRSSQQAAQQDAQAQMALSREIAQQELENVKAGIEAFKQGSAERLAAVQEYAALSAKYYGSDEIDKVKAAKTAEIAEERAYQDAQASLRAEEVRANIKTNDEEVRAHLAGISTMLNADGIYFQKQVEEANRRQQLIKDQMRADDQAAALRLRDIGTELSESERFLQQQQRVAQDFQKRWGNAFNTISGAFGSAFGQMLRGSQTFGEAMRGMFASIAESAVQTAAKNIATMGLQAAFGNGLRSAEIRKDAGAAAAAAYKAVVGIPYVGPFLAPAAAAVAYAGVLAFDSAEGGYDIPAGLNPITQLHQNEMVLPAPLAQGVRNMVDQQGVGGGSGGGSGGIVHIHGKPGSTFTQDQLVSMLRNLGHQFKLA